MKDLEIRGAGNLLGTRQSGHISAVGFSLYTRLLADAVEEQKALRSGRARPQPRLPSPAIDLPLDAFIRKATWPTWTRAWSFTGRWERRDRGKTGRRPAGA
jgi:transcription-repair coupling factor (superfamily II helicase)